MSGPQTGNTSVAPKIERASLSEKLGQRAPLLLVPALAIVGFAAIANPSTWLTLTAAGLAMGMMIFLMASGLTLVFGLLDVLNFGHGSFIAIGAFVGFMAAIMGVGGGFILIPAMIYILRMPTNVVIGTSFFQIVFVAALTGVMHSLENQAVDIVLGFLLVVGGVIGAQYGVRAAEKMPAEQLRALLAAILLLIGMRLGYDLISTPADPYSVVEVEAEQ